MNARFARLAASALVAVTASLFCVAPGFAAGTPPSNGFPFDIPAGNLKDAANKFAATVGADVVFDAYAARNVQTQPVHGQMSAESALNQMLSGTGLYYRYDADSRRVIISSRKE